MTLKISGLDRLLIKIKRISDPEYYFDDVFAKNSRQSVRSFIEKTPKSTGNTSRGWVLPRKLSNSNYLLKNGITTYDKKHSIIRILDEGRGAVRPVNAKKLYIPFSNKAKSKKRGDKIPAGLKFGTDFVLTKYAKPTRPLNFVRPIKYATERLIMRDMSNKLRKVF